MRRIVFAFVLFAILFISGCGYNTMQQNEEKVKEAWANVEAAYQRRNDLIPNLVETVKAYAKHERETLQAVVEARAKAGSINISKEMIGDPKAMEQFQLAQSEVSSALSRLMVIVERYPDLKAS
ncbi:MAG TPA: LemA family protein, partial [Syntrophorhabdaceae bacterium]|nr:LemA family protein [Syntrophorhabdaceae bacterium]